MFLCRTLNKLKEMLKFLGSRKFSVICFCYLIGVFLIWLVPFQVYGVPSSTINNIANKSWFFLLGYIILLINLLGCMINVAPKVVQRLSKTTFPMNPPGKKSDSQSIYLDSNYKKEEILASLRKFVSAKGFSIKENPEMDCLTAYKGLKSPLGSLLFHLSFFLIVIGIFVSIYFGFYGETVVTEGQIFSSSDTSLFTLPSPPEIAKFKDKIPKVEFRLEMLTPSFWENKLLFTGLQAVLSYGPGLQNLTTIKLNSPLFYKGNIISLKGFGYSPQVVLKDSKGNVVLDSFVNLRVFPSGSEDNFKIPNSPYEVHVILWSDYYIKNGKIKNKSFNLVQPLYTIYILKDNPKSKSKTAKVDKKGKSDPNKKLVYQGNLKPGEEAAFGGYKLSLPDVRYFGEFRIIRSPGVFLVFIGFVMAIIGLVWKLWFYRKEIVFLIESNSDGGHNVIIQGSREYYKSFNTVHLQELAALLQKALNKKVEL